MRQRIWLVRHGNREDFLDRNWSKTAERPHDPALSPDGEQQAKEVGASLRQASIDRIYASPFLRTIQTASYIADILDLSIHLEPGIGESLPGLDRTPLLLDEEERIRLFPRIQRSYDSIYEPDYPESEAEAHQRSARTVQRIADAHPDHNLLFVTHASPVIGIVRHLTGRQEPIKVPLCCIFTLERTNNGRTGGRANGTWQLVQSADVSHLSDQATSLRHAHVG